MCSLHAATVVYQNDFSTAQTIISATNGNTNYAGAGPGPHSQANINYGEWMEGRASNRVQLAYDSANERLKFDFETQGRTAWHLIDLSGADSGLNGSVATISFDVVGFSNSSDSTVVARVWDGLGLSFSGTDGAGGDGFLTIRSDRLTPNVASRSVAVTLNSGTAENSLASGNITDSGNFSMDFNLSSAGASGGFVLLGIASDAVNPGASFDIDDLQVSVVPEPSTFLMAIAAIGFASGRRHRLYTK